MQLLAFELNLHPVVIGLLVALFVLVSFMLMLIILIQRPQGGGLSEAFGSNSGSGHTAFGAKTGDALTTATIGMFVIFIVGAVLLNYAVRPPGEGATAAEASADPASGAPASTSTEPLPIGSTTTTIPIPIPQDPTPVPAPAPSGTPADQPTGEGTSTPPAQPVPSETPPVQPETQPPASPQ